MAETIIVGDVSAMDFPLALLSHENLHSLPQMGWKFSSAETTPLVIQQSSVTWEFIVYVFTLYFICLFLFLFLLFFYWYYFFQISHLEPFFTDTVFRFSFHDSVSGFRIVGLVFFLKAVVKFYFFVTVEGMLIYFLWSMPDIKPYID